MKQYSLFKALFLAACLLCSMSAVAAEAYANYTPSNTTLSFYCDNQRDSREGITYDLNSGTNAPEWYDDGTFSSVTRVVFDPSFADVTALIDILLSGTTPPAAADCNLDNAVNIADVTSLIDYLLGGQWP